MKHNARKHGNWMEDSITQSLNSLTAKISKKESRLEMSLSDFHNRAYIQSTTTRNNKRVEKQDYEQYYVLSRWSSMSEDCQVHSLRLRQY